MSLKRSERAAFGQLLSTNFDYAWHAKDELDTDKFIVQTICAETSAVERGNAMVSENF